MVSTNSRVNTSQIKIIRNSLQAGETVGMFINNASTAGIPIIGQHGRYTCHFPPIAHGFPFIWPTANIGNPLWWWVVETLRATRIPSVLFELLDLYVASTSAAPRLPQGRDWVPPRLRGILTESWNSLNVREYSRHGRRSLDKNGFYNRRSS